MYPSLVRYTTICAMHGGVLLRPTLPTTLKQMFILQIIAFSWIDERLYTEWTPLVPACHMSLEVTLYSSFYIKLFSLLVQMKLSLLVSNIWAFHQLVFLTPCRFSGAASLFILSSKLWKTSKDTFFVTDWDTKGNCHFQQYYCCFSTAVVEYFYRDGVYQIYLAENNV